MYVISPGKNFFSLRSALQGGRAPRVKAQPLIQVAHALVRLEVLAGRGRELQRDELEALALKASNDLADEAAWRAVQRRAWDVTLLK